MRSRICGIALLLALAAGSSACVVGRIGRASEQAGVSEQARAIAERIELPGREVEEASFQRCVVNHAKFFDEYYCRSHIARFAVVPGTGASAWMQLKEQLSLDGWKVLAWYHITREDFNGKVTIPRSSQIPPAVRGTRHEKPLDKVMNDLAPNESLLGLVVSFQTPTDVLRSHVCYMPSVFCYLPFF